jgi:DNA-binding CsgD family transcriptional regulator
MALGELVVFSVPLERSLPDDHRLTPSERDAIELALAGHSNAEIAKRRGVMRSTVAKQLASAYRKLKINSRAELAALTGRRRDKR